jgi:hypothetical protein
MGEPSILRRVREQGAEQKGAASSEQRAGRERQHDQRASLVARARLEKATRSLSHVNIAEMDSVTSHMSTTSECDVTRVLGCSALGALDTLAAVCDSGASAVRWPVGQPLLPQHLNGARARQMLQPRAWRPLERAHRASWQACRRPSGLLLPLFPPAQQARLRLPVELWTTASVATTAVAPTWSRQKRLLPPKRSSKRRLRGHEPRASPPTARRKTKRLRLRSERAARSKQRRCRLCAPSTVNRASQIVPAHPSSSSSRSSSSSSRSSSSPSSHASAQQHLLRVEHRQDLTIGQARVRLSTNHRTATDKVSSTHHCFRRRCRLTGKSSRIISDITNSSNSAPCSLCQGDCHQKRRRLCEVRVDYASIQVLRLLCHPTLPKTPQFSQQM